MTELDPYFHPNFFAAHMHDQETIVAAQGVNAVIGAYLTIFEVKERKALPEELQRDIGRMVEKVNIRL